MPMVTICPRSLNPSSLLSNLLASNTHVNDALISSLRLAVNKELLRRESYMQTPDDAYSRNKILALFRACQDSLESTCEFVALLAAIAGSQDSTTVSISIVRDYIVQEHASRKKPTCASLQEYIEARSNISLDSLKTIPRSTTDETFLPTLQMYTHFFPIYKNLSSSIEPEPLKPIAAYVFQPFLQSNLELRQKDLLPLLLTMIDRRLLTLPELKDALAPIFASLLTSHLDIADNEEISKIITTFQSDPVKNSFLNGRFFDFPCGPYQSQIKELCIVTQNATCKNYCKNLERYKQKSLRIKELFEMGAENFGNYRQGPNMVSFLPRCFYEGKEIPGEDCWQKVVTERGVCFSTFNRKYDNYFSCL